VVVSVVCLVSCVIVVTGNSVYSSQNNTFVVSLKPGQELKGFYRALATGTVIYKFWGIRYGQAPTGKLMIKMFSHSLTGVKTSTAPAQ
jgi:hypothetical protein